MSSPQPYAADDVPRLLRAAQEGGLQRLMAVLHRAIEAEVGLFDLDGSVLATAPDRALWDYEQVLAAREAPGEAGIIVLTVELHHEAVSLLAAREPGAKRYLVEVAAEIAALEIGRLRAGQEVRRELAADVLDDIIENRLSGREAKERMAGIGLDSNRLHRVLLGRSRTSSARLLKIPWAIHALMSNRPDPFVRVVRGEDIVMVVPDDPMVGRIAGTLLQHVADLGADARVGVSLPHTGANGLRAGYHEARAALRQGTGVQYPRRIDLSQLLVITNEALPLGDLARQFLRPLLDYDRRHGGSLLETLRVYLDADRVAGEAADRLFVHRNTLRYRLRQIEELLGVGIESSWSITNLSLAVAALGEDTAGPEPARN
ncbi:PucR family transcriptional regulator [Georgenia sp. AZ-5]|uniref:PucR family transcriptional regulator n=1 Tax=Georgenia sp. AZ-5 TaxID=3367526 RepID=UPI00375526E4